MDVLQMARLQARARPFKFEATYGLRLLVAYVGYDEMQKKGASRSCFYSFLMPCMSTCAAVHGMLCVKSFSAQSQLAEPAPPAMEACRKREKPEEGWFGQVSERSRCASDWFCNRVALQGTLTPASQDWSWNLHALPIEPAISEKQGHYNEHVTLSLCCSRCRRSGRRRGYGGGSGGGGGGGG